MRTQSSDTSERQAGKANANEVPLNPKIESEGEGPSNREKDPEDWVTGDEPMTGAQASYLKTLSEEANEPFEPGLSKRDASKRIDQLQEKTGRGKTAVDSSAR
ncbi:MAG TPA: DUF3072 domain-containing protein [Polyangia bacterium]